MTDIDSSDDLKHLILDMLSTTRRVEISRTASLSHTEWDAIGHMARQHRLGPILHQQSEAHGSDWVIPEEMRTQWAQSFRQSAFNALLIRKTLLKIDHILGTSSFDYAALKGAWLAHKAYPHPALRPMRDVDIIVAPQHVLTVFHLLESEGFFLDTGSVRPKEPAQTQDKHLPRLYDAQTGIPVEVHSRLVDHADQDSVALNQIDALLKRTVRAGGVNYLNPTDTLLHLVVHAVYAHQFNNGPLAFNDIATLVASTDIEWDFFWKMAETGGWTRGCELLFAIVGQYHEFEFAGQSALSAPIEPEQLESAKLLTLQDFKQRALIAFGGKLMASTSLWERLAVLYRRLIPTRNTLAGFSGATNAPFWVFIYYPKWLFARAQQRLSRQQQASAATDIKRASVVQHFLHGR